MGIARENWLLSTIDSGKAGCCQQLADLRKTYLNLRSHNSAVDKTVHKLLMEIPVQLETARLIIKKYVEGDGREFYLLLERNNNRELLREEAEEVLAIKTEEEAEVKIRRHSAEWFARDRFVMGIWLKNDRRQIGEIWIEPKNWEVPSFEIGWLLDSAMQGRGLATEAARRSLEFLFNDLKAHKVIVVARDTNHRSCKLAERLGFRRESHLRESEIEGGKRFGLVYYGMLRHELRSP